MQRDCEEACPRCGSAHAVRPKSILIGAASPSKLFPEEEKTGYRRLDQLAIDECEPQSLNAPPLEQFINGLYCDQCAIGFVANTLVKGSVHAGRK
ncbi:MULTISPECIES: hypothetical protein [unclassified Pseudomonas]|uniref:hypothetical protein n=1 Tax=unclassified Pseudomonas TaxID=196821 RepID=UPI00200E83F6|nr:MULTISPECIES: hypothetical protein [unclassified Pseudomonas]